MLAQVRAGGVHQVVTYKLDRLGRSMTHPAIIVGELQMRNVALICPSQGIATSKQNPVGQLQLGVLIAAVESTFLKLPPGDRLEALKGDRRGQHSIRINDQWRLCFRWAGTDAEQVEIIDYH